MSRRVDLVVPGDPAQLTGGYLYDANIAASLRAQGWTVTVHGLPGRFPDADAQAREALDATLSALPAGRQVVIDGLALGGLPELAHAHAGRLDLIALIHHPLADEGGLCTTLQRCLLASERAALAAARTVITTSRHTARRLAHFGVRPNRLQVVEPGVRALPLAAADADIPKLLCVASLTPRKGHGLLAAALARVADLNWQCDCIGSLARDPVHAGTIAAQIAAAGLDGRVRLSGECTDDALCAAYAAADLFVLPSRYEGYGMVITEAVAAGLPVLTTSGGALGETLPHGAGLALPVDDVDTFASALRDLLSNREHRLQLRDGARRARSSLRDWTRAGFEFATALDRHAATNHLAQGRHA